MVFTDPSGYSWLSRLWKNVKKYGRTIVAIVVAVIVIYAPYLLAQYGGVAFGTTVAGTTTLTFVGTVAVGALAGFASGAIMTGTLSGALKGAAWGAVSAGVAFGIGHSSAFSSLYKAAGRGASLVRATAHGLSRGIISMAQGGTFKAGFASGFSSSFFSPGTTMGGDGAGGFGLRTSIAAVVGGTASKIGGGKFSNGAVSGAFVHMFNAERVMSKFSTLWKNYPSGHPSKDGYANQCAIRMSVALQKSGFNLDNYKMGPLTTEGYARGAKSLADYLWKEIGRPEIMLQSDFEANYRHNSSGIMFELASPGGVSHIDLNNYGQAGSGYYKAQQIWYWKL